MDQHGIEIRKLTPHIGAEIRGVDLAAPLGDATFKAIHDALIDNCVIFFRDQHLTVEQQKAFGRRFGELHVHPAAPAVLEGHPEILVIHADDKSKRVAGEEWHSDVSCDPEPPMGSILYIHELPPVGGDTLFASMYAAYDRLSPSRSSGSSDGADRASTTASTSIAGATRSRRRRQDYPAGRASRDPHPSRFRPEGALRQPRLHDPDPGPQEERERRRAGDALPAHRDA